MSITLKWLIYESKIDNLRCMTCPEKLDTPITSVNILDNPDVVKWIKHNELVLTTGYIFKDNPERQRRLIRDLYEAGCAALCIKIKRFFRSIPAVMIDEAEKVGLPLIEIPFFYSFSDISKTVYHGIYSVEMIDVQREQKLVAELSFLFFNKGTVFEMLYRISDFFGKPVVLLNRHLVSEDMVITSEYSGLCSRGDAFETDPQVKQIKDSGYQVLSWGNKVNVFFIVELPDQVGFLCMLDEMYKLSDYYQTILKKAGIILAMALERDKTQKIGSTSDPLSETEQFMEFLTKISDISQEQIIHLCDMTGFDYKKKRVCITLSLKNATNEREKKEINNIINNYIKQENNVYSYENIYTCCSNNSVCIFLLAESIHENPHLKKIAYDFAEELKGAIEEKTGIDIPAGISRCHIYIDDIRGAYIEALNAMLLNQRLGQKGGIASYSKRIHYHFLSKCTQDELKDLYMDNVECLERYDKDNNAELLSTLKAYFTSCFNVSETAKKLFVHRNTLSHRLEKIRDILNISLEDMEEMFALYLEMCAADLLE
ncbi:MAG: PucR family transcriptional regulator [Ruminiclostridium sp.]